MRANDQSYANVMNNNWKQNLKSWIVSFFELELDILISFIYAGMSLKMVEHNKK